MQWHNNWLLIRQGGPLTLSYVTNSFERRVARVLHGVYRAGRRVQGQLHLLGAGLESD